MDSIRDINTETSEGKILIATLSRLTTLDKYTSMTPDETLIEMNKLADDIFKS